MSATTFAKSFILDGAKIMIMVLADSCGVAQRWIRFPKFYHTDYFYMETYSWDAVIFIPRRNIKFLGFGIMASYNDKDMKYDDRRDYIVISKINPESGRFKIYEA